MWTLPSIALLCLVSFCVAEEDFIGFQWKDETLHSVSEDFALVEEAMMKDPSGECQFECLNGGTCVDGKCQCIDGWKGLACGKVDACVPPCENGGTCVRGLCQCAAGWHGHTCSKVSKKVDGNWGSWSEFSECSVTCGGGTKVRSHECDNPPPAYGGEPCPGDFKEYADCSPRKCPRQKCLASMFVCNPRKSLKAIVLTEEEDDIDSFPDCRKECCDAASCTGFSYNKKLKQCFLSTKKFEQLPTEKNNRAIACQRV